MDGLAVYLQIARHHDKGKIGAACQDAKVLIVNDLHKNFVVKLHKMDFFLLPKLHKMEYFWGL